VDEHLSRKGGRTDLGEMAQMATCEALTALGTPPTASLFEDMAPSAQEMLKGLSLATGLTTPGHPSGVLREGLSGSHPKGVMPDAQTPGHHQTT